MGKPAAVATATLQCSMGLAPSVLNVLPTSRVMIEGRPAGTIMDAVPGSNVPPFGMCTSPANPAVAAATAAALGTPTPAPCLPVTAAWTGGAAKTFIGGKPGLTQGATLTCAYGGVIQIISSGAVKTMEG